MYKATMSVERFEGIRRFLRFGDKKQGRSVCKQITWQHSDIFDIFLFHIARNGKMRENFLQLMSS